MTPHPIFSLAAIVTRTPLTSLATSTTPMIVRGMGVVLNTAAAKLMMGWAKISTLSTATNWDPVEKEKVITMEMDAKAVMESKGIEIRTSIRVQVKVTGIEVKVKVVAMEVKKGDSLL